MEKVLNLQLVSTTRYYISLTKPGIIFGNTLAALGGYFLGARGAWNLNFLFFILLGLALVIGSACIFNNYIDRQIDSKMERTKNRAFVKGLVKPLNALFFALVLLVSGAYILAVKSNPLTTSLSLLGFIVYVLFYSLIKHHNSISTLIGSIAGAIPPLVGYCSVKGSLDVCALIVFLIFALWQMPHFYSIAIYRLSDYKAANVPVLPVDRGVKHTIVQMILYVCAFLLACVSLTTYHYVGKLFFFVMTTLSLVWLGIALAGLKTKTPAKWAKGMFIFSLIVIMSLSLVIPLSTL